MRSNLISLKKTLIDPQLLCLIFVGEMMFLLVLRQNFSLP